MRPATPADHGAIHSVEEAAFGREDEAQMVESARAEGVTLVELVEERDGRIVGHILFSRMAVSPPRFFAALAPVAVCPELQGRGIGDALCRAGIEAVREIGAEAVILLGHPDYYPRFGFSHELAKDLDSPYAANAAFMAMELKAGALTPSLKVDFPAAFG